MITFVLVAFLVLGAYSVLIIRFRLALKRLTVQNETKISLPSISVVVALKNEEINVSRLLKGLQKIDYPGDLDFIFVNDNSTDNTQIQLQKHLFSGATIINNDGEGKKKAIESGVKASKAEWIAVTDADCLVGKHWLSAMMKAKDADTNMILGPVFIDPSKKDVFDLQKLEFQALQGATAGSAALSQPISANAANMLFKRHSFIDVKPYHNNWDLKTGDDQFLMMAISKSNPKGVTYAFIKDAIVQTMPVKTIRNYWKQRIRWASKGGSYTDWNILFTGIIVFVMSLISIKCWVFGLYTKRYFLFIIPLIKMAVDYFLTQKMSRFGNQKIRFLNYFITGVIYPFVVVVAVLLGFAKGASKSKG